MILGLALLKYFTRVNSKESILPDPSGLLSIYVHQLKSVGRSKYWGCQFRLKVGTGLCDMQQNSCDVSLRKQPLFSNGTEKKSVPSLRKVAGCGCAPVFLNISNKINCKCFLANEKTKDYS